MVTPEQFVAIISALAVLIGAVTALLVQVARIRGNINGRLDQLVQTAALAAEKRGELAGRDFIHRLYQQPLSLAPPSAPARTEQHPAGWPESPQPPIA